MHFTSSDQRRNVFLLIELAVLKQQGLLLLIESILLMSSNYLDLSYRQLPVNAEYELTLNFLFFIIFKI